jgi:hypothetical protein
VTVDPSGLIDWEKLQERIWAAGKSESDFLAAMPVDGLDSADTQGLIDADAGFLGGLVTAAEGVSGADLSALRALIRKGRLLATGINVGVGIFGIIRSGRMTGLGDGGRFSALPGRCA